MTIVITANTSWNIYNFRLGLINHFQSLGHIVFFASPYDDYTKLVTEKTGATHINLKSLERKGMNPFKDFLLYSELKRQYKKYHVEVALHYTIKPNIYGSLASKSIGVKSISNVTGLGFIFLKNSFLNNLVKRFFKYALNKSDKIVLQNDIDKAFFIGNNFFKKSKINIIYGSGVNIEKFKPQVNNYSNSKFVFLFIGRLLYDKGVVELFEAFNDLCKTNSNIELHLVGEIDNDNPSAINEKQLKTILKNNNSIVFFGKINNVATCISNASCVVLPSYREGLPKSLLEAMAMAKPIITTNAPGCSQLVNNNGYLCEAKSAKDLQDKMQLVLSLNKEILSKMGEASLSLVLKNYDEKIIVKNYENLIKEIK